MDDLKNSIYSSLELLKEIKSDDPQDTKTIAQIDKLLSSTFDHFHNFKYFYYFKNNKLSFENNIDIKTQDLIDELQESDKTEEFSIKYIKSKSFPDIFRFKQNVLNRLLLNLKRYSNRNKSGHKRIVFKHYNEIDTNLFNVSDQKLIDKEINYLAISIINTKVVSDQNTNENLIKMPEYNEYIKLEQNYNYNEDVNLNLCYIISYMINSNVFLNPNNHNIILIFQSDKIESIESTNNDSKEKVIKTDTISIPKKNGIKIQYSKLEEENKFEHNCDSIILVEDSIQIMKKYINMCNKRGLKYVDFYDGTQAKDYITKLFQSKCKKCKKELLILSDQVMPEMKGTELHEWLTEYNMSYNWKINFILVTANEDTYEGIDNVVFKPLTIKRFTEIKDKYYSE